LLTKSYSDNYWVWVEALLHLDMYIKSHMLFQHWCFTTVCHFIT
jgi:hypothetical protein